ncbi:MAG: alpha/beta fold hydrolase [Variovorax sp.]|nr:MAG: alpha/beta fold hydrolase [Variovorax sp.]
MRGALEWAIDGRDWPNRAASRFVEVGELRWHVQQMGSGPLLLLLHGTGASTHTWRDLMPLLARDFTCVAVDLPGHAFTRAPKAPAMPRRHMSLSGMAAAIARLMAQERMSPVHIVGHSAGAAIAAQLCLVEGLAAQSIVSLNGAFLPLPGLQGMLFPSMARVMATNLLAPRLFAWNASNPAAVQRLIAQTGSRLDARGEALYASLVRNPVHVAAALAMMASWDTASLAHRLPHLQQRLLLVAGDNDRTVPPSQARQVGGMVPHAVVARIERCGHLAHEEQPEGLARRLSDWCLPQQPASAATPHASEACVAL